MIVAEVEAEEVVILVIFWRESLQEFLMDGT